MIKKTHNIFVCVATNFEDIELIGTIDILTRDKINLQLVSVENLQEVHGKYHSLVKTIPLDKVDYTKFTGIFIPGGPGYKIIQENKKVLDIIKNFAKNNQLISAICAGPEVLIQANVINKQMITAFPGHAQIPNNSGKDLEIAANLITARDYEATFKFAKAIVHYLKTHNP